jgi:hypothetical protein
MKTANENVLRLLARVTASARAGDVEAVVIVAVKGDGMPDVSFGGAMELMPSANLGVDMFKHQLMQQASHIEHKPVSSLVRAAGTFDS